MSTKQQQTSTNQYNPGSLTTFNALQGPAAGLLQTYMNNPEAAVSPYYNLAIQQGVQQAGLAGQTAMSNITGNMAATGFGGQNMPAFIASQMAAQQRATSGAEANASIQGNLAKQQAALGVQQAGLQGALGYKPLQTGGTQVNQTGGLGSWLPQIIGAGLGAAGAAFGGQKK